MDKIEAKLGMGLSIILLPNFLFSDRIEAKLDMGSKHYSEGKLEEALSYYTEALGLCQEVDDPQKEADILLEIGNIQAELGDIDNAHLNYEKSLNLFNQIHDYTGAGYSLTGIGIITERYKKYEEARDYYEKAIKMFKKAGDHVMAGTVSNMIADTYEMQDALEDALVDYERSLKLFAEVKDYPVKAKTYEVIDKRLVSSWFAKARVKAKLESKRSTMECSKQELIIVMGYLGAFVIAELLTILDTETGLVAHTTVLGALLINSSLNKSYNFSNFLRSMLILPMIRIIGFTMPIMGIPYLYILLIVSIPLFAASFIIMRNQGLNMKKVGLIWGNIPVQILIALTGIILGITEYFILRPEPIIPTLTIAPFLIGSTILIVSTGLSEELFFRGIIQRNAENVFGRAFGLLYVSLLFACFHIGWRSPLDLVFVFIASMFFGYMFQKTGSIFGISLSHGITNIVMFLVMPFLFP